MYSVPTLMLSSLGCTMQHRGNWENTLNKKAKKIALTNRVISVTLIVFQQYQSMALVKSFPYTMSRLNIKFNDVCSSLNSKTNKHSQHPNWIVKQVIQIGCLDQNINPKFGIHDIKNLIRLHYPYQISCFDHKNTNHKGKENNRIFGSIIV